MARPKTYRSIDAPAKQPWRPFHAAGMERGGLSVGKGAKEMNMIDAATNPNGAAARYINLQQPDLQRKNKLDLQGMVNQGGLDRQRLMNHGQMGVQGLVNQGGLARQGLMNQGQLNTQRAVNSGQLLRQRLVNQGAMDQANLRESGLDSRLDKTQAYGKELAANQNAMAERLGKYKADKEAMGRTLQSIYDDPDLTMEQKIAAANKVQRSMMFSGGGLGDLDLDVTGDAQDATSSIDKKQKKSISYGNKNPFGYEVPRGYDVIGGARRLINRAVGDFKGFGYNRMNPAMPN